MMSLAVFVLGWTAITSVIATVAFVRSRPRPTAGAPRLRDAILLRPCAGEEPGLAEALASAAAAPPNVTLRFLVASADDPAAIVATRVAERLRARGRDARVVVTGAAAPNKKADQLARALDAEDARHDVVLVVDSDVRLTASVVERLLEVDRGAVWAPPIEGPPATLAARMSGAVLDASLHAFALLAGLDANGMVGKAMAVERAALDAVGGFAGSVDRLGEDMHLAARLRGAGYPIASVAEPALSIARHRSVVEVVLRYARWLTVIRGQRPWLLASYPALFAAAPIQLALAATAFFVAPAVLTAAAIGAVVAVRLQVALFARLRSGRDLRGGLAWSWLADVTLLAALAVALSTRRFRWRGSWLRLDQGRIFEVER